jgi:hypothetical protein
MTSKATNLIGLGRPATVKTFTRLKNLRIVQGYVRQARSLKVATHPYCVAKISTTSHPTGLGSKLSPVLLPALILTGILFFAASVDAQAETRAPGWEVTSTTFPTNLAPSGGTGTIEVNVYDVGAEASNGTVTVTDELPAGVVATQAGDIQDTTESIGLNGLWECFGNAPGESPRSPVVFEKPATVVTCTNTPLMPSLPIRPGNSVQGNSVLAVEDAGVIQHLGIAVSVQAGGAVGSNHVTVAGGGATTPASTSAPIVVSSTPASSFGFQGMDGWLSSADGTVDTQAGSHPYEFAFSFDLNTKANPIDSPPQLEPVGGELHKLVANLPPGFVGNPTAVPECARQQFEEEACSPSTQVGLDVADVLGGERVAGRVSDPVYNLVPPPGVPAQFAFEIYGNKVYLDAGVRSGSDYGITSYVDGLPQTKIMGNRIVLWGEPSNPSHDQERLSKFGDNGICSLGCPSSSARVPFLTLPTSCPNPGTEQGRLEWSASADTWETGALAGKSFVTHEGGDSPTSFTGCDHLGFGPSISVAPDTSEADTPAGLTVDVRVPQEGLTTPGALVTSDIKDTTVVLPKGVVINPGQAAGLQSCPAGRPAPPERYGDALTTPEEKQRGEEDNGAAYCPNASKVGAVEIETPLLHHSLKGDVYVLQSNPPNLQLLVTAEGEGVFLKLVGNVSLCESTGEVLDGKTCEAAGQLITRFTETPELPFTDFKLAFTGGAQAALDTPTACNIYSTSADFTPWSSPAVADASSSSAFAITAGPGGAPCPSSPLPFSPSLIAGSTTDQAGGFTSFSLLLQRGDEQQRIEKLSFKAPQGLSGMISAVPVCPEPQASQGTCSAASQIGHSTVASGPGPYPLTIPQPGDPQSPIYLTGPYEGAPFGLTIVTHVLAGPFDLGTIVTRAKIEINPYSAQITVTTDPLPQVIDGVPTDLRLVDSVIDRPGFMFNPTTCNPQEFSGTATGTPPPGGGGGAGSGSGGAGATAPIGSHFQVGSCQSLKFEPKFTAFTSGKTSRSKGANLTLRVQRASGPSSQQANFTEAKIELPKQLPSRLTTLQRACPARVFEANPAACPPESDIGHVKVVTPILPVPLEGPAYFVSHGNEAFPSVTVVLQGDGVTIVVVSTTFINKAGITSATIKTVPDQPFTSFELTFPEGAYSALAANANLCKPGRTVTTKKTVTKKIHGHTRRVVKKTTKQVAASLKMPTEFIAQNGLEIHQSTPITVTGCPKPKAAKKASRKRFAGRSRRRRV